MWKNEHIVAIAVSSREWGVLQKSQLLNGFPRGLLTGKGQKEVLEAYLKTWSNIWQLNDSYQNGALKNPV